MIAFAALAAEPRWVSWRTELRGDKPTKVPYCPTTGRKAKADDPATWAPRAAAERRAERIVNGLGGGVGIQLGDLGDHMHLCGIDLDSCLEGNNIAPWAARILEAAPSYAERSPSGKGVKVFFLAPLGQIRPLLDRIGAQAKQWGVRRDIPGEDPRNHGPAIEIYCSHRYFAVTGEHWPNAPETIELLEGDALARLAGAIPPPRIAGRNGRAIGDNSRSAIAFRKGAALRRAGKSFKEMCAALRADPETAAWCREKGAAAGGRELRRVSDKAEEAVAAEGVSLDDFHAYMPMHNYIYVPTRSAWPAASVNARIRPIKLTDNNGKPVLDAAGKQVVLSASAWLDRFKPVEQMTWAPGQPMIILDKILLEGGFVERRGATCFNQYHPPDDRSWRFQAGRKMARSHQVYLPRRRQPDP
jgi:hypothetical protein